VLREERGGVAGGGRECVGVGVWVRLRVFLGGFVHAVGG